MAGVDPLTVKNLGGWRTLAMVQRYAHLAPDHLRAAIERLVPGASPATELARDYPARESESVAVPEGVS